MGRRTGCEHGRICCEACQNARMRAGHQRYLAARRLLDPPKAPKPKIGRPEKPVVAPINGLPTWGYR